MRISHVQTSRPAFYDRNPIGRAASFESAAGAPHADTARWSYTNPAAKKCAVSHLTAFMQRVSAAAPVGLARSYITYTPSGGAAVEILMAEINLNTIEPGALLACGSQMVLFPGDTLIGRTADASTGGTINYGSAFMGVEFDA